MSRNWFQVLSDMCSIIFKKAQKMICPRKIKTTNLFLVLKVHRFDVTKAILLNTPLMKQMKSRPQGAQLKIFRTFYNFFIWSVTKNRRSNRRTPGSSISDKKMDVSLWSFEYKIIRRKRPNQDSKYCFCHVLEMLK